MERRELGVRLNFPYLQGAYLAFNAVPDVFFLGDGPSCIFAKALQVHGRHDLFSTLLSCESEHRVQHTGVNVFNIAGNYEKEIGAALRRMASWRGAGALFLGSMPMCSIAGTDYERILREALDGSKPAFVLPRRSAFAGDWLDGYAAVMEALAAGMELAPEPASPDSAALVGYLMDRNEGEHRGNVAELERILRALGLDPVSTWLSGKPYESLREVRRAGTVISLPHGRKAARILSRRLGARLIEADLPFGLEATRRFVELLGREFAREERARGFIKDELDRVAPRLQWSVPHVFLNRRFAFIGDPLYGAGFAELIEELGGEIAGMILMGGGHHLNDAVKAALEARPRTEFQPVTPRAKKLWEEMSGSGVDLVLGNSWAFGELHPKTPWLEFGFPSDNTHFLNDEPFLGFSGALAFLSRAANEVTKGWAMAGTACGSGQQWKATP